MDFKQAELRSGTGEIPGFARLVRAGWEDVGGKHEIFRTDLNHPRVKQNSDSLVGSVEIGWGKFVCGNAYVGLAAGLAVGKNKTSNLSGTLKARDRDIKCEGKLKQNGLAPRISLRGGYYLSSIRGMVYVKAGLERNETELKGEGDWVNSSSKIAAIAPVVGAGIEKALNGKLSAGLECNYTLPTNKTVELRSIETGRAKVVNALKTRVRKDGWNAKLTLNYHI